MKLMFVNGVGKTLEMPSNIIIQFNITANYNLIVKLIHFC